MPKIKKYALCMLIPIVGIIFWILTIIQAFKYKQTVTAGIFLVLPFTIILPIIGWIMILAADIPAEEQKQPMDSTTA